MALTWIGIVMVFIPLTGAIVLPVALKRKQKEEGR
jgi:hypothetical protein